jgi:hypothetical protein
MSLLEITFIKVMQTLTIDGQSIRIKVGELGLIVIYHFLPFRSLILLLLCEINPGLELDIVLFHSLDQPLL